MALGAKTGGRQKGTLNKSTSDVKVLAEKHGPNALAELARLSLKGETEQVRVSACREILDRAYGKPSQYIEHTGEDGGAIQFENVSDVEAARMIAYVLESGVQELEETHH